MTGWKRLAKGFTVVELLIVIVVIAVLATILVVGYSAVQNNAKDAALKSDLQKFADAVKLKTLDDDDIPAGGATSALTGDSTRFPGMTLEPNRPVYDLTVNNLFYCEGDIDGSNEFAFFAKGTSGSIYYVRSDTGVSTLSGSPSMSYSLCSTIGFSTPYTWSYGYNPGPSYGWFRWTYEEGSLMTNLATNPSMESNVNDWQSYLGVGAPTRVTTNPDSGSARLSAVGNNTSLVPRVHHNIPATPGDTISVSVRVRSDGQTPTKLMMYVKPTNGTTELSSLGNERDWDPDSSGWMTGTYTFVVPAGADGIRINPGVRVATNYTGTLGVDSLIVVKGDTIPTFADGNSFGWEWNGTTNNSTSTGPPL